MRHEPAAALHRTLLQLAGEVSDALLRPARAELARGDLPGAAGALLTVVERHPSLCSADVAQTLADVLPGRSLPQVRSHPSDVAPPTGPVTSTFSRPQELPARAVRPAVDHDVARDVDQLLTDYCEVLPDLKACWRVWRQAVLAGPLAYGDGADNGGDQSSRPGLLVILVADAAADLAILLLAAEDLAGTLRSTAEHDVTVEAHFCDDRVPTYLRVARDEADLVWVADGEPIREVVRHRALVAARTVSTADWPRTPRDPDQAQGGDPSQDLSQPQGPQPGVEPPDVPPAVTRVPASLRRLWTDAAPEPVPVRAGRCTDDALPDDVLPAPGDLQAAVACRSVVRAPEAELPRLPTGSDALPGEGTAAVRGGPDRPRGRAATWIQVADDSRTGDAERVREHLGPAYETHARRVAACLSVDPVLRALSGRPDDLAGLVALSAQLAGELPELGLVLRDANAASASQPGGEALARIVQSGLRRLPVYRGAVFLVAAAPDAALAEHRPGRVLVEPGFVRAAPSDSAPAGQAVRYAIWSVSARRVERLVSLAPEAPIVVMFAAGTRFRVLDVDDDPGARTVFLEERPAWGMTEDDEPHAEPVHTDIDGRSARVLERVRRGMTSEQTVPSSTSSHPLGISDDGVWFAVGATGRVDAMAMGHHPSDTSQTSQQVVQARESA